MPGIATERENIVSLDEFYAEPKSCIDQLRESGQAMLIVEGEEPTAVLVDAEEYSRQQFRLLVLERVAKANRDIPEGKFYTQEQVDSIVDGWIASSA